MRIAVRFFGPLRDIAGAGAETVVLEAGAGTAELVAALVRRHPRLDDYLGDLKMAVNRKVVKEPVALRDGDEVALLPPVSGG